MKINFYRKLILAFFLISVLITCVLFVPFYKSSGYYTNDQIIGHEDVFHPYYSGIEYGLIWSEGTIISQRLLLELFVILSISGVLYILVSKFSNPDFNNPKIKKIIKREILIFLGIVILIFLFWGYLNIRNYYLENKRKTINNKISENTILYDSLRKNILTKKKVRKSFFETFSRIYKLDSQNKDIISLWKSLENGTLYINVKFDEYGTPYKNSGIPVADDIVKNHPFIDGNIFTNQNEFNEFIRAWTFTKEDIKNDSLASIVSKENSKLHKKSLELYFAIWDNEKYNFANSFLFFLLIYPIRLLYYLIKQFYLFFKINSKLKKINK